MIQFYAYSISTSISTISSLNLHHFFVTKDFKCQEAICWAPSQEKLDNLKYSLNTYNNPTFISSFIPVHC